MKPQSFKNDKGSMVLFLNILFVFVGVLFLIANLLNNREILSEIFTMFNK